jgi:hypothetical protein
MMRRISAVFMLLLILGCSKPSLEFERGSCSESSDCRLPKEFVVKTECSYKARCHEGTCLLVCELGQNCIEDDECDCSPLEGVGFAECMCLDNRCAGVIED